MEREQGIIMFEKQRERIRYEFENYMSKGGLSIFISLIVLFVLFFVVAIMLRGVILLINPEYDIFTSFSNHIWVIFLEMTDPGNMNRDTDSSLLLKFSGIVAGMLGVIIFSMLIAFITTEMYTMLEELKKGHSKVLESDHTLILGWNERVLGILRELIIANESEKDASVVILANKEKSDMDSEIKRFFPDTKTTRVITRTGSTSSLTNLYRVGAESAKSAILLASCPENASKETKRNSDARVIKTILAVLGCQKEDPEINIVAELFFETNRQLLETIEYENISSIDSWDILGKILVQTSRTCGLAVVYNEILSFDGCELYFYGADWDGMRFYDILYHFADGVPMGIRRRNGTLLLRPNKDEVMNEGDEVLILAEDDSTINYQKNPVIVPKEYPFTYRQSEKHIERELLLGWHNINSIVIREYADYLMEGSSIDIMIHHPSEDIVKEVNRLKATHDSLNITLIDKDPMSLRDLTSIDPFSYDNVLIVSHMEEEGSIERADSETLVILLMLRKIFRDLADKERETKIITQILNSENQDLIAQTNVDDFLISNKMVTMIFSQLSEEAAIKKVYDDIFEEEGSEIYLKPASLYFDSFPMEVTFADMMAIALKRNEICIGLRRIVDANKYESNFGIKLNPKKDSRFSLTPEDSFVVLAEDEL